MSVKETSDGSKPVESSSFKQEPSLSPPPPEIKSRSNGNDDDDDIQFQGSNSDPNRVAQAKVRYEADLKKHHYEPPVATRLQDDWQVAYVWAFVVKFQLKDKIRKLECLEDFERALVEPVANRPDDVLENILIRFLSNLKPGIRNLNCTNIQNHLSNYLNDQLLNSSEFTVWDRPWAPNEEPRGPCCNESHDRTELGRLRYDGEPIGERAKKNPIAQMEERGGGLFELDWRERAKLLRQLVDWQLTHADNIRGIINKEYQFRDAKTKNADGIDTSIVTVPLGQDRDKGRIWAFDNSGRIYRSGNPFKRPCPLISIAQTREELDALHEKYKTHGSTVPEKPKPPAGKSKPTAVDQRNYQKLCKGIEEERNLAEKLDELVPLVEKEEQRIQRARKRIAAALQAAQLVEFRETRTRRSTRKVDYTYADDIEEIEEPANKRSRNDAYSWEGSSTRGKPIAPAIPGERRSARVANARDEASEEYNDGDDEGSNISAVAHDGPIKSRSSPVSIVMEDGVNGHEANGAGAAQSNGDGEDGSVEPSEIVAVRGS